MAVSKPTRPEHWFASQRVRAATKAGDGGSEVDRSPGGDLDVVTRDLGPRGRAEIQPAARWDGREAVPQGPGIVGRVPTPGRAAAVPIVSTGETGER